MAYEIGALLFKSFLTGLEQVRPLNCLEDSRHSFSLQEPSWRVWNKCAPWTVWKTLDIVFLFKSLPDGSGTSVPLELSGRLSTSFFSSRAFLTGLEQVCPLHCLEDSRHRFDQKCRLFRILNQHDSDGQSWCFYIGYFASVLAFNFDCFSELVPRSCQVYKYNKINIYQCSTCHSINPLKLSQKIPYLQYRLWPRGLNFCLSPTSTSTLYACGNRMVWRDCTDVRARPSLLCSLIR